MLKGVIDWVKKVIDWGMSKYYWAMENALSIKGLRTYYTNPDTFTEGCAAEFLKLTPDEIETVKQSSIAETCGMERADKLAKHRIHHHGLLTMLVTFLCALPDVWLSYALIVVDIIFFQMQVFVVSQELYIIYCRKEKYSEIGFDFKSLIVVAVKMEGTLIKNKVAKQAKKGVGKAAQWIVRRSSHLLRGPMQAFLRQALKWTGVTITKEMIEGGIALLLSAACALIAGFISYWMFLPMARRLQRDLKAADPDEESEIAELAS